MSFTDLKLTELKEVAETFGVDLEGVKTKQETIALLEEEGITYKMYSSFKDTDKAEIEIPETEKKARESKKNMTKENSILVKMERGNHSYQASGYTFTQEHPFVAMPESDAQRIFDTQEGFRLATPREAQEYYA